MAALAKSRPLEPGETMLELVHSFVEVMKTEDSWREIDYISDVFCSHCGDGPVLTNRFKCLSCSCLELCLACFRNVDEIHPVHAWLAVPDRPARPPVEPLREMSAMQSVDGHVQPSVEDLRLAFLRARGLVGPDGARPQDPFRSNSASSMPLRTPARLVTHPNVLCFGCLQNIVGARFSCSVCVAFDLCSSCEASESPRSLLPSCPVKRLILPFPRRPPDHKP